MAVGKMLWKAASTFGLVVTACMVMAAAVPSLQVRAAPEASGPDSYLAKVKPLLETHCGRCHEGMNRRGGLNMETRESLLKGGHHGPALIPGDPVNSLMVKLINHAGPSDNPMNMPPNKAKLSDEDIRTIADWIKAGASMPASAQQ